MSPWSKITGKKKLKEKIQELEKELEACKEDRERLEKRFEAEKDRRSRLSTEKQEVDKELKKLRQKLENQTQEKEEKEKETREVRGLSFRAAVEGLNKLSTINSEKKDLLTVYSSEEDFTDSKALKNSASQRAFREIKEKNTVTFTDEDFFRLKIKTRPFFETEWHLDKKFRPEKILEFIEKEKYWVLAERGHTRIFSESSGDVEEVDRVKTRVDSEQKKGGFSQGRFERKRDEQAADHVELVNEALKEIEGDIYVLGDRRLCENVDGEYLGGFDSSRPVSPDVFYNFQITRF